MRSVLVRVKVEAGARKETFEESAPGTFAISVKERAERNAANTRVRAIIARHFRVPLKMVRILTGHQGKNKTLQVLA
jgi:uncharacterized protein YggU (UPF0235/DUF167 family)